MPVLQVEISKKVYPYAKYPSLENIKFSTDGIFGVLGGIGAGKTTLLNCICGLVDFQGSVLLDGQPINTGSNSQMCYMPNDYALFKNKSAIHNIAYPLLVRSTNKTDAYKTAADAAKKANIFDAADIKAGKLTKTQQLKVMLARCYTRQVKLILADDIFSSIAQTELDECVSEFCKLINQVNAVTVLTASNPTVLKNLDCNTVFLDNGYDIRQATIDQATKSPQTLTEYLLVRQDATAYVGQVTDFNDKQVISYDLGEFELSAECGYTKDKIIVVPDHKNSCKLFEIDTERAIYFTGEQNAR